MDAIHGRNQGCQMVCLKTKNPNLGKFWRGLAMEDVSIPILSTLDPFYGHLLYFMDK
jgi:hypothetical protein